MRSLKIRRKTQKDLENCLNNINHSDRICSVCISYNKLSSVGFMSWKRFKNLSHLNLSHNQLETLDGLNLTYFDSLVRLDISYNRLKSIDENVFDSKCNTPLRELYLQGNKLAGLPGNIGNLRQLQVLILGDDLAGNDIGELPESLCNLEMLRELRAPRCNLVNITPKIFVLHNLEILDLFRNQIASLPANWSTLERIKEVNLSGNLIDEIPSDLRLPDNLEKLDLSSNLISEVPMSRFVSIMDLSLNVCCFETIEVPFVPINNNDLKLQELSLNAILNSNELSKIPPHIRDKYSRQDGVKLCGNCPFRFIYSNQEVVQPGVVDGHHNVPIRSRVCSRNCALLLSKSSDGIVQLEEDDLCDF